MGSGVYVSELGFAYVGFMVRVSGFKGCGLGTWVWPIRFRVYELVFEQKGLK